MSADSKKSYTKAEWSDFALRTSAVSFAAIWWKHLSIQILAAYEEPKNLEHFKADAVERLNNTIWLSVFPVLALCAGITLKMLPNTPARKKETCADAAFGFSRHSAAVTLLFGLGQIADPYNDPALNRTILTYTAYTLMIPLLAAIVGLICCHRDSQNQQDHHKEGERACCY